MGRPGLWLWMKAALLGQRPGSVCWEGVFTNGCGDMWRGEACFAEMEKKGSGPRLAICEVCIRALRRPKG